MGEVKRRDREMKGELGGCIELGNAAGIRILNGSSAYAKRTNTLAFHRIERNQRNRKSGKLFVFNTAR